MALGRDDLVDGALTLLDRVGFDGLTMRRLAQSLGVQAGGIYWHFESKQALVDAMADTMLAGLLEPPVDGAWDQQIAELCRRLAASLLRRRDGARLATQALRPGPNGLAITDALLRILRRGRKRDRATSWAAAVIGYYVLGYVTDLQATEAARARGLLLQEMITGAKANRRFEFGLQVILRGLKATKRPARRGS